MDSDAAQPPLRPLISAKHDELAALCRKFKVERLDLFGSAATDKFDPLSSDLDFIALFSDRQQSDYAHRFLDFADALETLFGRRVDLLTENMIHNPYFRQTVEATRRRIYENRDEKAVA